MDSNYDLVVKLLSYANVNEDFLIDYEKDIQEIVSKLDLLDKIKKLLEEK